VTACIAPSAATVSGGVHVGQENCPSLSSSWSGFWSIWTLERSAFQVPSMLPAAKVGAAAFSVVAAF
jgi:hypothetical protein